MRDAILIGGANGAGKTTFARQAVPVLYPSAVFLNVDEIQLEGGPFAHPISAGRELLNRLSNAERRGTSFALETTLSSNTYAKRISFWRTSGYYVALHFIELPSEAFAVKRVAMRVASGGHPVPEDDVRRRFHRGIDQFHRIYKQLVDEWYHWESNDEGLRLAHHSET